MFSKTTNDSDEHYDSFETRTDEQSASSDELTESIIGRGLSVVGNISTEGNLHINGDVEGEIRASVLIVGKDASVRADIFADDVVISGSVVGAIHSDKVRLANTAVVEGSIRHRLFAIEAGARFEGTVQHADEALASQAGDTSPSWGSVAASSDGESDGDKEEDGDYSS